MVRGSYPIWSQVETKVIAVLWDLLGKRCRFRPRICGDAECVLHITHNQIHLVVTLMEIKNVS